MYAHMYFKLFVLFHEYGHTYKYYTHIFNHNIFGDIV